MWHKLADGRWLQWVVNKDDPSKSWALMSDKRGGMIGRIVEGQAVHCDDIEKVVEQVMGE